MQLHAFSLRPRSAFGTPLAGDTLFGQLCWAVRERFGEARLCELLAGYTEGHPFMVASDGFPAGFLPRPGLPDALFNDGIAPDQRKAARRLQWLPFDALAQPAHVWPSLAVDLASRKSPHSQLAHGSTTVLTQNTINRLTGTTGTGPFAPRQVERFALGTDEGLEVYVVIDEHRFAVSDVRTLLTDIGLFGFGRDASTGLGKFEVGPSRPIVWPVTESRHAITLAPCAPNPVQLDSAQCFYLPQTRFGRHGNVLVRSGNPFKRPVQYMKTAAFLSFTEPSRALWHGTGLGGARQPISLTLPETVHQGYAPVVPVASGEHA